MSRDNVCDMNVVFIVIVVVVRFVYGVCALRMFCTTNALIVIVEVSVAASTIWFLVSIWSICRCSAARSVGVSGGGLMVVILCLWIYLVLLLGSVVADGCGGFGCLVGSG